MHRTAEDFVEMEGGLGGWGGQRAASFLFFHCEHRHTCIHAELALRSTHVYAVYMYLWFRARSYQVVVFGLVKIFIAIVIYNID